MPKVSNRGVLSATRSVRHVAASALLAIMLVLQLSVTVHAEDQKISKIDFQIDASDPGIKLFMREKMLEGNATFTNRNIILFVHGATSPSTCDFDLAYKDYSWADWFARRGYVVYMGDYRNYGFSSREAAMDAAPAQNQPLTRSYLAVRDIEAMVNHIKTSRGVSKVNIIGWSWGAMMAGYYASLYSDNIEKLVLYAPLYNFNDHTNVGAGSPLQDKRQPTAFNFSLGAYRIVSEASNTARWNGEIPVENKDEYRDPAVPAVFWNECLATDPSSATRNPPSLRAPNGVLEDSFYQATGRPLWNAANIYAPTMLIAGAYDTWSFAQDREGLFNNLFHAAKKQNILVPDATHFMIFEKQRFVLFDTVLQFLKSSSP